MNAIVGRDDSPPTAFNPIGEYSRWIGKPWHRIEKMWHTHTWKGETDVIDRTYSLHFGLRRFGLSFTFSLTRADCLDYSEERE